MIGNDIVDLTASVFFNVSRRDRYAAKVLSKLEQRSYAKSANKTAVLWRYWSIKEATYKAFKQLDANCNFTPSKITVKIVNTSEAIACYNGLEFSCITVQRANAIYTTAFCKRAKTIISRLAFKEPNNCPSKKVRSLLIKEVSKLTNIPRHYFFVIKNDEDIPRLYTTLNARSWQISLTHHGTYIGYAIAI